MDFSTHLEQSAKAQLSAKLQRVQRSSTVNELQARIQAQIRNELRRPTIELVPLVRKSRIT